MLEPGPRLLCAASMVRGKRKIVDIGTDHAYLPAYLVLNGIAEDVLACDIGIMPLENAKRTVAAYSLQEKIGLRVSDGLSAISPDEAQEIIICGMGGTLIAAILTAADWIKKQGMHLILQPMTHSEDVRRYLSANGFVLTEERHIIDNNRVYCCISADYTGEVYPPDEGFCYFGRLPVEGEAAELFVAKRLKRLDTKLNALKSADSGNKEIPVLEEIRDYYEKRMKCDCTRDL